MTLERRRGARSQFPEKSAIVVEGGLRCLDRGAAWSGPEGHTVADEKPQDTTKIWRACRNYGAPSLPNTTATWVEHPQEATNDERGPGGK